MHDAIVVGGGPAGATAAAFLARQGRDVLLLDKSRFPRDKPCSEYLNPEMAAVLDRSGALGAVDAARPAMLRGMCVTTPGGRQFMIDHASGARALERRVLDDILLTHARAVGATVHTGVRVEDVLRTGATVTGVVARQDGQRREYRATLVFGCDGPHSVIGQRLGLLHDTRWLRRMGFVLHMRDVPGLKDYGEFHLSRRYYVGVAPLGNGRANVTLIAPAAEVPIWRGQPLPYVQRLLQALPGLWPRLQQGHLEAPLRVIGPLARSARRATVAGVVLIGDAAGFLDPFTGEGLYRAVRGAELAGCLAARYAARSDAAMLVPRLYEGARHVAFQHQRLVAALIQVVIQRPWLIDRVAYQLSRKPMLARMLGDITADRMPARRALSPRFLAGLLF